MMARYFILLVMGLISSTAMAAYNDVPELVGVWGGGTVSLCQRNSIEITDTEKDTSYKGACIGASRDKNCKAWVGTFDPAVRSGVDGWDDEGVMLMMIATSINEHGAKFCPIEAEGRNKGNPVQTTWTEYRMLDINKCVWLCKEGYYGDECDKEVLNLSSCPSYVNTNTSLNAKNYDSLENPVKSGDNIEFDIEMFYRELYGNENDSCGNKEEHDMVLAVSQWDPNGHGAFVRPFIIASRAANGGNPYESAAEVWPAKGSKEILVCQDGYEPNKYETGCVLIDVCNDEGKSCCTQEQINNHFVCDTENNTCTNCATGYTKSGDSCILYASGNCGEQQQPVTCKIGQKFDKEKIDNGCCVDLQKISKQDLKKLSDKDCWMEPSVEKYIECIKK